MHTRKRATPQLLPNKTESSSSSTRLQRTKITTNENDKNKQILNIFSIKLIIITIFVLGFTIFYGKSQRTDINKKILKLKKDLFVQPLGNENVPQKQVSNTSTSRENGSKNQKEDTVVTMDDDEHYNHNYHLIFSTDCSAFQHWQSYLMFHSAYKVNQPGTITRIASGCSDEEGEKATKWHKENVSYVMGDRFKLHLTPHFSSVKDENGGKKGDYKFFNKPFGLLHWLEHGIGFQEGSSEILNNSDDIVILIDPDMLLLRPITGDFSNPRDVLVGRMHQKERKYFVKHGAPFAQTYGFGTQWQKLNFDEIAGENSPAKDVSRPEGGAFYPVGPPYLATVTDMYQIALKWTEFVPKVHKEYPHLLAEMFAFCIAAAHLGLKHQLLDSLMVSNYGAGGEGWPMVDNITQDKESSLCDFASKPDHSKHAVPSVIHYCQHYAIGEWFFGKRKMVKNFFECESPLMEFPPSDIIETTSHNTLEDSKQKDPSEIKARRQGFVTCAVLGALNDASVFFKEHSCKGIDANMAKEINLIKH